MQLCKEFTFDSAHFLANYNGKCERMHGHTYRLRVFVKGPVREDGLVMDFAEIKEIVQKKILDRIDHTSLNDLLDQPSAENICIWIWGQLKPVMPLLCKIQLWETPTSFAIYDGS